MTDKFPTFEQETIEKRLVKLLKEKGPEDPEAFSLLTSWIVEQEQQVERSGNPEAAIQFNLRRARLYFDAGYIDESLENYEAAQTQAWNEGRDELYQKITDEIQKQGEVLERLGL